MAAAHLVLIPKDSSVVFQDLRALAFWTGMLPEFVQQTGFFERQLPSLAMKIKSAALVPYVAADLGLVDGAGDLILL